MPCSHDVRLAERPSFAQQKHSQGLGALGTGVVTGRQRTAFPFSYVVDHSHVFARDGYDLEKKSDQHWPLPGSNTTDS